MLAQSILSANSKVRKGEHRVAQRGREGMGV